MQFRHGLVVAWLLATLASILVAFAAVGSVRTAIADPPSALLIPGSSQRDRPVPSMPDPQPSTTMPDPKVVDGAPDADPDGVGDAAASPQPPGGAEAVSEPAPAPETTQAPTETAPPQASPPPPPPPATTTSTTASTTTTVAPSDTVETYETEGGRVTVRSNSGGVYLESASPNPGWTVETEGRGPDHFTVVFERAGEEIHVKVEFEDGRVKIEIED